MNRQVKEVQIPILPRNTIFIGNRHRYRCCTVRQNRDGGTIRDICQAQVVMGTGSRTLCAAEKGISLCGRCTPVEVAHLDLGHLDSIVFVLLVVHLEVWCLLPGGFAGRASVTKGELEGTMGSSTLRDSRKEQVVSIAALVDVSRTEKSDSAVKILSMIEI